MNLFGRGTSLIPDIVNHLRGGAGLPRDHVLIAVINFIYSQNDKHNPLAHRRGTETKRRYLPVGLMSLLCHAVLL